jgi:hypothetical protein
MSRSTDEHIADAIAAIKGESQRWSAMAEAQRTASRTAGRQTCLLVTALSSVLMVCALVACALTAKLAVSGTLIAVPVFVAVLGLSGSLLLYVVGAAVAYRSVVTDQALGAGMRFMVAITMTGRALFMGTALATVLAGVLVAAHGLPSAAVLAVAVAVGVAVLGQKLGVIIRHAGAV